MIDAKLLQSFMSDIEWLRTFKSPSAKDSTPSTGASTAQYSPFEEMLAKTIASLESKQSQDSATSPGGLSSTLQLMETDLLNGLLNPGSKRDNVSKSLTSEDIDKLFPELANLKTFLN